MWCLDLCVYMYRKGEKKVSINRTRTHASRRIRNREKIIWMKSDHYFFMQCCRSFVLFCTGHVLNNTFIFSSSFLSIDHAIDPMLLLCCYSRRVVLFKIEKKTKNTTQKWILLAPTWQYTNREDGYETGPIHIFITQSRKRKQNKSMC